MARSAATWREPQGERAAELHRFEKAGSQPCPRAQLLNVGDDLVGSIDRGSSLECPRLAHEASQPPTLPAAHDVARALWTPATTRMQTPFLQGETVVKSQFLPRRNLPPGNDPDSSSDRLRPTIRRARMVDQPRDIAPGSAVQIVPCIQFENIDAVIPAAPPPRQSEFLPPIRFGLRNAFTRVFDHARAGGN